MTDPFARPTEPGDSTAPGDDLIVGGRYKLPDPDGGSKDVKFTRATTFAKSIADTYRLSLWQQRKAVEGVVVDASLYAKAATIDWNNDRKAGDKLVEESKVAAGAKKRATLGTAVHAFSDQLDAGKITLEQVPAPWRPDLVAYRKVFADAGLETVLAEKTVLCQTYHIAGTFDRLVRLTRDLDVELPDGTLITLPKGCIVVLDLKTGRDLEYGWREIAIQLALYANSELIVDREAWTYTPMPDEVRTDVALVLHLPVGEGKATLHALDIVQGWRAAWLCEQARNWNRVRELARPVLVAEADDRDTLSNVVSISREPSFIERINSAQTITGLMRVKIDAERAGKWTTALRSLAERRRDNLLADIVEG